VSDIEFPEALDFLFEPSRYKVLYGGRGGGKSWGIARALLIKGTERPLRILCAREFMASISDSVHKLLSDQIYELGMDDFYTIEKATIRGINGTEFRFAGIRSNVQQVKSFEGIDIAWLEEAANVSKASFEVVVPTIRKPNSEIWISLNPELDTDYCYKQFVADPPPGALVRKINYDSNPWFPQVLRDEMELLKERDPDAYQSIWLGNCRQMLEGAVYANEIRAATEDGRFCRVPWEQSKSVHTFFDLGRGDRTSIWFVQIVGFEYRLIDFYENTGLVWTHYLKMLQDRPYVYGDNWLPHDATHELLASQMTIEQQMRAQGFKVRITPKTTISDGINAARTVFGKCWFDAEKCSDGLQSLRHYRYDMEIDAVTRKREPRHDWASHAADSFRYMAVGLQDRKPRPEIVAKPRPYRVGNSNWMGA
jgi:phage terminase large subunit